MNPLLKFWLLFLFAMLLAVVFAVPAAKAEDLRPSDMIHHQDYNLYLNKENARGFLRPGKSTKDLPDAIRVTITCFKDGRVNLDISQSYTELRDAITTAGSSAIYLGFLSLAAHTCSLYKEVSYDRHDQRQSSNAWNL